MKYSYINSPNSRNSRITNFKVSHCSPEIDTFKNRINSHQRPRRFCLRPGTKAKHRASVTITRKSLHRRGLTRETNFAAGRGTEKKPGKPVSGHSRSGEFRVLSSLVSGSGRTISHRSVELARAIQLTRTCRWLVIRHPFVAFPFAVPFLPRARSPRGSAGAPRRTVTIGDQVRASRRRGSRLTPTARYCSKSPELYPATW